MTQPVSIYELSLRPEYQLFTLRDRESDARVGAGPAIAQAHRSVVAATEYEAYVHVAQPDLPVHISLEVWTTPPATSPARGWTLLGTFDVPFSSGHVVLGDGGGQGIDGPWLQERPGVYTAEIWTHGREDAAAQARHIDDLTRDLGILDKIAYQDEHGSGVERYIIRLWWHAMMPEDHDEWNE